MKCLAAVVILSQVAVGAMQVQAGDEPQREAPLPQGQVTIEAYVPTVLVEAERWAGADEPARQSVAALPRFDAWVVEFIRRDLAQIFTR